MAISPEDIAAATRRWQMQNFASPFLLPLAAYGNLLLRWNTRISLTSIRDEAEVVERHILEGVFAASKHPEAKTSLDFGSGTGVPGLLIAICRPEIQVTLAESQRKKAAFLAEAIRELQLDVKVHGERAETLPPASFDAVWMRAVDRSASMLPVATALVHEAGRLCLFETKENCSAALLKEWDSQAHQFPVNSARVLHIYRKP